MLIRIVDLETTGTDPGVDQIVEIASIDIVPGERGYSNPQDMLVDPHLDEIPPQASAVHHILIEDIQGKPSLGEVLPQFRGADFYVAHNAEFEQSFLPMIEGPWICTLKCALRLWPEAPSHGNQALRYWLGFKEPFGIPRDKINPHRALSDVWVTGCILQRMFETQTLETLRKWSEEPKFMTKFHFGKFRGERLTDVPADYLQWILRSDLDADTKSNAKREIDRRLMEQRP